MLNNDLVLFSYHENKCLQDGLGPARLRSVLTIPNHFHTSVVQRRFYAAWMGNGGVPATVAGTLIIFFQNKRRLMLT
jgi:hypothetical protein